MAEYETEAQEVVTSNTDSETLATLSRAEIDTQIATAHRFPRSIKSFRNEALQMATLDESIARECVYALPRGGKTIEGASARFAEIVASAWGNCRAGARVIDESKEFVTAQGVFHDLQRNVQITYEVQRRITDKYNRRYNSDMIAVTANAACSIALRNAILKGVPKAFWSSIYEKARLVIRGDYQTLNNRRANAIKEFQGYGVTEKQLCAKLDKQGVSDITVDDLVLLAGMITALRDNETTPEEMFADAQEVKKPQPKDEGKESGGGKVATPSAKKKDETAKSEQSEAPKETKEESKQERKEKTPSEETKGAAENGATANMLKQLKLRMEAYEVNEGQLLGFVGATTLEELTIDQVNEAMKWIEENI